MDLKKNGTPGIVCAKYGIVLIFAFYVLMLMMAAVLSPIIFHLTKFFANTFSSDLLSHYVDKGLWKFFDRLRIITALAMLPVFLKLCRIRIFRDISIQTIWPMRFCGIFFVGIALVSAVYTCLWLTCDNTSFHGCVWDFVSILKFFLSALVVGVLEEVVFRGVVYKICELNAGTLVAIAVSSVFFAYCHVSVQQVPECSDVTLLSGFQYIFPVLFGFVENFSPQVFFNLAALGVLLASIMNQSNSVFAAAAFHSGAVFAVKCIHLLFKFSFSNGSDSARVGILDTWYTLVFEAIAIVAIKFVPQLLNVRISSSARE